VKIGSGDNIYEGMRMIMPEHRDMINRMAREEKRRVRPILADYAIEEMGMTLSEAVAERLAIRVTLFGEWEDQMYEGVPEMRGQVMYVDDGEKRHRMELAEIVMIKNI